jgi:CBS domain-containing protein
MICPFCGTENIEGAEECVNCGQSLYGLDTPEGGLKDRSPAFIQQPISRLPQRPPAFVKTSDPVGLAIRRMQLSNTGSILVMDGEELAGILTDSDILHKVAGRTDMNSLTCSQIMTPDPITVDSDDRIAVAVNVMAAGGFRHIPVVEDGKPVAVIGVHDVFMYISPNLV